MSERARTLPLRVLHAVRAGRLWSPGQRVLVAVSGGLDSTVLLVLLARLADGHKGRLEVCSLDHGLRPEAAGEVAAVGRLAAELGLPFYSAKLEIAPGPNLYARARDARRAALLTHGADRVATAHHLDDQAETVLYHMLRGSGPTGLRGMLSLDAPWCRPLLGEPRAVIHAFAKEQGLTWVEDSSNAGSQRGQLRRLMPLLDEVQGGSAEALARSARLLAREEGLLAELASAAWDRIQRDGGLDWAGLNAEHPAIRLRLLRLLLGDLFYRADQIEAALEWTPKEGASLQLSGGWRLVYEAGLLRLAYSEAASGERPSASANGQGKAL